jgi:glycosyltransferase involved in cell wall biosynthesis
MQVRPKVLFISSWYPNKTKPTEGNFVQQHIRAAQLFADVALVHVVLSAEHTELSHEVRTEPFEEHIIYIPKNSTPIIGLLLNYLRVFQMYFKYTAQTGLGKPNLIHANVLYPIGLVGVLLKWKWRIPLLFTEHWTCYHDYAAPKPNKLIQLIMRWLGNRAQLIMPVSLDLAAAMQQFGIRARMKVIANVVDTQQFSAQPKKQRGVYRFLHVSSLDPEQKNFHLLVRAFYELKKMGQKVELHVVSDGNFNAYSDLINDFDFYQSIHFHGQQDASGVAALMKFADALVLSSRFENLPCVLIEALSSGTPMIATDVGGVPEIVNPQNGMLVPSENLSALVEAMTTIQTRMFDAELLHQEAELKYSPAVIGGLLLEAYSSLLQKDVA